MTEAMPFLQEAILLSYAPGHFCSGLFGWGHRRSRISSPEAVWTSTRVR